MVSITLQEIVSKASVGQQSGTSLQRDIKALVGIGTWKYRQTRNIIRTVINSAWMVNVYMNACKGPVSLWDLGSDWAPICGSSEVISPE